MPAKRGSKLKKRAPKGARGRKSGPQLVVPQENTVEDREDRLRNQGGRFDSAGKPNQQKRGAATTT
jgi:hypothetical protein